MATSFSLYRDDTLKHAPNELRPMLTQVLKDIPSPNEGFLADAFWKKQKNSQWVIKCSEENLNFIKTVISGDGDQEKLNVLVAGYKIQFRKSRKKSAGATSDAQSTRKQELGSAWIMRRALRDKVKYTKYQDIVTDKNYHELEEIYPEIDEEWLKGYFLQQKKMLEEFASANFTEFNREGGFMKFITDVIRVNYGISQKDNWNPADIWLLKDEKKVMTDIAKVLDQGKVKSIAELNTLLRTMFKQRRVVGISLKKISGKQAQYEEVNIDEATFKDLKNYNYSVQSVKIDLSLKGDQFSTQDSRVFVDGDDYGIFNFQIKGNDTSGFSNLKWEPTLSGAAAARLGKAPVEMTLSLLKEYGITFYNDHAKYPKTTKQFEERKAEFNKMFTAVKNMGAELKVPDTKTFAANIDTILKSKTPHIANSKLMQLTFLYELSKLPKEKRDSLMTDLAFIAMKKGDRFGPFGKLY